MSDEDSQKEPNLAEEIAENIRPWNGYWSWKDKPIGERGAAREILRTAGIEVSGLVSRGHGCDPPDCEAVVDGQLVGIEITELVHQPTLERSIKAKKQRALGQSPRRPEAYFVWDREELIRALQERIDAKDQAKLKGGPYSRYVLVIHTDEVFLGATQVEQWLAGATFRASRITDILLGLSYNPAHKRCPVFRLPVTE